MRQLRVILLVPALLAAAGAAAGAGSGERWYACTIGGVPVGFARDSVDSLRYVQEMQIALTRLGKTVEIGSRAEVTETPAGELRELRARLRMSAQETVVHVTVEGESLTVRSAAGGREHVRRQAAGGVLLGPEGIRRRTQAALRAPGDSLAYRTFAAELGAVVAVTRTMAGHGPAPERLLQVEERHAGMPPRRLALDGDGHLVSSEEPGPFGTIRVERTDRERALASRGGSLSPEMYERTLVRANVRLPQARAVDRLRLRLTHRAPEMGWPELDLGNQRVLERTAAGVLLEVVRPRPPQRPEERAAEGGAELREMREANAILDADDPAVRRIAATAAGSSDAWQTALFLERWVADSLRFDPGIALAPAGEVARDRRGTCAAYASLLTALCRAAGIPARYVMGWVYLNGAWGGHAWTEARIGGRWLPLDAAVDGPGAADAARFAFAASSLAGGAGELVMAGQRQYGQVEIAIEEYEIAGRTYRVPPGAPLSRMRGATYENPGLGLTLTAPAGFTLQERDAMWPRPALVWWSGPGGARLTLEQRGVAMPERAEQEVRAALKIAAPAGRPTTLRVADGRAAALESPGSAAAAIVDGLDLWVLRAEGPDSPAHLRAAAATLRVGRREPAERP